MTFNFTNTEKIMGAVILALVIFFIFWQGCGQNKTDDLVDGIVNYKDSAEFYKLKVNGKDVEIAYNQSLVLENKNQLEALIKKNDTLAKLVKKFKDVKSTTIIKTVTQIQHDTIPVNIPCDFSPVKVKRDSLFYHFVGTISPKYFSIDSITIPNKQSIVIGKKKLGFLKGAEERVEIINSNPLIKTTNIQSYVISKPKKFYETRIFAFSCGILGGGYLTYKLVK